MQAERADPATGEIELARYSTREMVEIESGMIESAQRMHGAHGHGVDRRHAPSVLGQIDDEDRVVSANTFSKSWTMTGWRLGWLIAPRSFIAQIGKVIEFNTSCAPTFVQKAGIVAVRDGDALLADTVSRLHASRDLLVRGLAQLPGVEVATPPGAMYLFFRIAGRSTDSLAFAKRLVAESGLGIAPGIAFGPEGEGYLRWCFAASEPLLDEGVARLGRYLAQAR